MSFQACLSSLKRRKRRRKRRWSWYLQQVTADSCEDEAGHDHPASKTEEAPLEHKTEVNLVKGICSSSSGLGRRQEGGQPPIHLASSHPSIPGWKQEASKQFRSNRNLQKRTTKNHGSRLVLSSGSEECFSSFCLFLS